MIDLYNLKDYICIELFFFMVMLLKRLNGKFKNVWFWIWIYFINMFVSILRGIFYFVRYIFEGFFIG